MQSDFYRDVFFMQNPILQIHMLLNPILPNSILSSKSSKHFVSSWYVEDSAW